MEFKRYSKNPIITPNHKLDYERESTYNPCAIVHKKKIFLIYRAEGTSGNYVSKLCLAKSKNGYNFKKYKNNPIIVPTRPEEKRGCEDPRISKIGDTFYLTYTAYKSYNKRKGNKISLSLTTSKNLINWKKQGIILKNMKAGYIYPEKVRGKYLMFVGEGKIKIARSKNLINWKLDKKPFLAPRKNSFDNELVEVGPPFIFLKNKIIMIYNSKNKLGIYSPSYLILDRKNPTKILYRSKKPIMIPSEQFELYGKVDNVVFAEGLVEHHGNYFLYYGGADKYIGFASIKKKNLIKFIERLGF